MKWISGFRHFLSWLCLQVRYSLKHLERLSRSVLASLRYTPVRKRRVYLLYCSCLLTYLLVLGIKPGQVYAQEDTPTPTNQPIYVTPTPEVEDFTCPGTQPQGWGEVTPSAYWNLKCGQCVTPVSNYAWPTLDPDVWGTPVPTEIQGVTEYEFTWLEDFNSGVQYYPKINYHTETAGVTIRFAGKSFAMHSTESGQYYTNAFDTTLSLTRTTTGTEYSISLGFENLTSENITVTLGSGSGIEQVITIPPETGTQELFRDTVVPPGTAIVDKIVTVYVEYSKGWGIDYRIWWSGATTAAFSTADEVWDMTWYQSIMSETEPETGSGYCATVEGEEAGGLGEDEDTFQLPGINIGVADCVTVAGITVPLDWTDTLFGTGWEDWILPGMQICFTPIDFGTLTLFGITIDLDLIALGMAGVVLIRLITRS